MSDINGSKPTNFPLDESKLSFKIPRDEHPRENLLKLGMADYQPHRAEGHGG